MVASGRADGKLASCVAMMGNAVSFHATGLAVELFQRNSSDIWTLASMARVMGRVVWTR